MKRFMCDIDAVKRAGFKVDDADGCDCLLCPRRLAKRSKRFINDVVASDGEWITVATRSGARITLDRKDFEVISAFSCIYSTDRYGAIAVNGKTVPLHRYLLGIVDTDVIVDHKNHNPSDNRRCNLRTCTFSQNAMNASLRQNNTSGKTGVSVLSSGLKWKSELIKGGTAVHCEYHDTFGQACAARRAAEIEHFGEFRNKSEMM